MAGKSTLWRQKCHTFLSLAIRWHLPCELQLSTLACLFMPTNNTKTEKCKLKKKTNKQTNKQKQNFENRIELGELVVAFLKLLSFLFDWFWSINWFLF